jgi:hypothetical protein
MYSMQHCIRLFKNLENDHTEKGPICFQDLQKYHGLINYLDTKAKCRPLKKFTCKGTLQLVFIRVYRLVILSVMLEFSAQLCELLPH